MSWSTQKCFIKMNDFEVIIGDWGVSVNEEEREF